jgi:hypothetical protein
MLMLGVGLAIGSRQPFAADVGVALRGRHVGVAQQFLNRSEIGTTVEQMRGEAVSECVWMGGAHRSTIDDASHVARREARPRSLPNITSPASGGRTS